ncbi:MAG: hypothetical protein K5655_03370 [Lachnospiraceae bacterium]|nr:hypothetical protein [Lachnospiraceae bacterium]
MGFSGMLSGGLKGMSKMPSKGSGLGSMLSSRGSGSGLGSMLSSKGGSSGLGSMLSGGNGLGSLLSGGGGLGSMLSGGGLGSMLSGGGLGSMLSGGGLDSLLSGSGLGSILPGGEAIEKMKSIGGKLIPGIGAEGLKMLGNIKDRGLHKMRSGKSEADVREPEQDVQDTEPVSGANDEEEEMLALQNRELVDALTGWYGTINGIKTSYDLKPKDPDEGDEVSEACNRALSDIADIISIAGDNFSGKYVGVEQRIEAYRLVGDRIKKTLENLKDSLSNIQTDGEINIDGFKNAVDRMSLNIDGVAGALFDEDVSLKWATVIRMSLMDFEGVAVESTEVAESEEQEEKKGSIDEIVTWVREGDPDHTEISLADSVRSQLDIIQTVCGMTGEPEDFEKMKFTVKTEQNGETTTLTVTNVIFNEEAEEDTQGETGGVPEYNKFFEIAAKYGFDSPALTQEATKNLRDTSVFAFEEEIKDMSDDMKEKCISKFILLKCSVQEQQEEQGLNDETIQNYLGKLYEIDKSLVVFKDGKYAPRMEATTETDGNMEAKTDSDRTEDEDIETGPVRLDKALTDLIGKKLKIK